MKLRICCSSVVRVFFCRHRDKGASLINCGSIVVKIAIKTMYLTM